MNTTVMMQEYRQQVEQALRGCFRQEPERASLYDAMRYSLLAGGKRIRPVLVLEACRVCGGRPEDAMGFACALEMIHTYSLIHDDLPCMDDDDLRRGKPTNHKVFGEATAVLAGDGLLTAAFEVMVRDSAALSPAQVAEGVLCLSRAAGPGGMVGGQALDLAAEGCDLKLPDLQEIHSLKTGALIRAAVELGAIAAGASQEQRQALDRYADKIGLAFQIQDDILDVVGEDALLGKPVGSDRAGEKSTFVRLKGLDSCRELVRRLTEQAVEALASFEEGEFLTRLAWDLSGREM